MRPILFVRDPPSFVPVPHALEATYLDYTLIPRPDDAVLLVSGFRLERSDTPIFSVATFRSRAVFFGCEQLREGSARLAAFIHAEMERRDLL